MSAPSLYSQLDIPDEDRLTSIREEEADVLAHLLKERGLRRTLEVGFAYGCSTAYIMDATGAPHVAIDPYQDAYGNRGLKNINALGLQGRFELRPQLSRVALPALAAEGRTFDFIFIDGGHKYDEVFLDWALCDPLLEQSGFVVFDDAWMDSVKHVAAFIRANRADYHEIDLGYWNLFAFQKLGTDTRNWDHFVEFCPNEAKTSPVDTASQHP